MFEILSEPLLPLLDKSHISFHIYDQVHGVKNMLLLLGGNVFKQLTFLQGNTHNDYLRYGKRIIHEGYHKYNTSKAIHYA